MTLYLAGPFVIVWWLVLFLVEYPFWLAQGEFLTCDYVQTV